jgi:hypothetical protein
MRGRNIKSGRNTKKGVNMRSRNNRKRLRTKKNMKGGAHALRRAKTGVEAVRFRKQERKDALETMKMIILKAINGYNAKINFIIIPENLYEYLFLDSLPGGFGSEGKEPLGTKAYQVELSKFDVDAINKHIDDTTLQVKLATQPERRLSSLPGGEIIPRWHRMYFYISGLYETEEGKKEFINRIDLGNPIFLSEEDQKKLKNDRLQKLARNVLIKARTTQKSSSGSSAKQFKGLAGKVTAGKRLGKNGAITRANVAKAQSQTLEEILTNNKIMRPLIKNLRSAYFEDNPSKSVSSLIFGLQGAGIDFSRDDLLRTSNNAQCHRTMGAGGVYGLHPQGFNVKCSQEGETNCWQPLDTRDECGKRYKFVSPPNAANDTPFFSKCWICGQDLEMYDNGIKPSEPPQCEHKLAVIEGILLSTIPYEFVVGVGYVNGLHGYAPACARCNKRKTNLLMCQPTEDLLWTSHRVNILRLVNNFITKATSDREDLSRWCGRKLGNWEENPTAPAYDTLNVGGRLTRDINYFLSSTINDNNWLVNNYYGNRVRVKSHCIVVYYIDSERDADANKVKYYVNPFHLLAKILWFNIHKEYLLYFFESWRTKTVIYLQLLFHEGKVFDIAKKSQNVDFDADMPITLINVIPNLRLKNEIIFGTGAHG